MPKYFSHLKSLKYDLTITHSSLEKVSLKPGCVTASRVTPQPEHKYWLMEMRLLKAD